jgi:hypothetical protein
MLELILLRKYNQCFPSIMTAKMAVATNIIIIKQQQQQQLRTALAQFYVWELLLVRPLTFPMEGFWIALCASGAPWILFM